ncbi:MAG: DUF4861 family protein [Candidatus Hodarchaeales archaeon]
MKSKNTIFILCFAVMFSLLLVPTVLTNAKVTARNGAVFDVTAGTTALKASTPIIIDVGDLPITSDDGDLATAIVYDADDEELPTQADDLDGDGAVDEIVFQLPAEIAASGSATFTVYVEEGTDNGQDAADMNVTQGEYADDYADFLPAALVTAQNFMNGTTVSENVGNVGDVVWIKTGWGVMCMYVEAGWRQSAFKHIVVDGVDIQSAKWNASGEWQWDWSRMFYDSDPGWQNDAEADTVNIKKVGPVRAVVQTTTGVGYKGLTGDLDNLKATRTYTFYNSFQGIAQNLRMTGSSAADAADNMTALYGGPLKFVSKFIDQDSECNANSNCFNNVYAPGTPNLAGNTTRYVSGLQALNVSELTANYLAMYNAANDGFAFYWGDIDNADVLEAIDWSGGEIVVKQAYDTFPLEGVDRVMVPFKGEASPQTYVDTAVGGWIAAFDAGSVSNTSTTKESAAPGFELPLAIFAITVVALIYRKRR